MVNKCSYVLKTNNINYEVDLDELKKYLKIDSSFIDDDDYIKKCIKIASKFIENYTNRIILNKTYILFMNNLENIKIYFHKVRTINNIKYYDNNDNLQILDNSFYKIKNDDNRFQYLKFSDKIDIKLTENNLFFGERLQIEFISGFGETNIDIPEEYINYIYRIVAYLYNFRGDCIAQNIDINNAQFIALKTMLDYTKIWE